MNAKETVIMREILDAADLFAAQGNANAAMACQTARTKEEIEAIKIKHGTNLRIESALKERY